LLALMIAGCAQGRPQAGEMRIGLAQAPMTLDPRYATDAASVRVQELVHRGLVRLDDRFMPQPDVARSWDHPTPLLWIFHLRPGIRFHDGTPLTSRDAAATLDAILDASKASPLRSGFAAIQSIEPSDPMTLKIVLSHPDASLLTRLAVGILPASLARGPQLARSTIGCGPFRFRAWDANGLILDRVDVDPQPGSVQHIRFIEVKDPVTRCLKLVNGELDLIENDLPPRLLPYLASHKDRVTLQSAPSTTFSYLGLNLQDPALSDVRVRRALALAIDRDKLKQALFSDMPVLAETILSPQHWAYAKLPVRAFDPVEAGRLLDEAGLHPGKDGVRLVLDYSTSTDPTRLNLATAIASMWRRVGVEVHVHSMEWGGFYARIKQGNFQVFSLSWVGIVDPDIYRWVLSSQMWPPKGANRGRYRNAEVDQWLDAAAQTEDRQARAALYAKVEQQMWQDVVYIPLWYEPVIAAYGPRVSGFALHADGSLRGLAEVRLRSAQP
ncbi:MAG TPA: ABC transporter substrate-binding protein, partial [Mariprofundaceae bacterium]|nr:ABC transporter substrate-binding protein [Mariprofundaceae bacterium]